MSLQQHEDAFQKVIEIVENAKQQTFINIHEVSRRMGHENVEETWNTYCHMYPKEAERAINALNNV